MLLQSPHFAIPRTTLFLLSMYVKNNESFKKLAQLGHMVRRRARRIALRGARPGIERRMARRRERRLARRQIMAQFFTNKNDRQTAKKYGPIVVLKNALESAKNKGVHMNARCEALLKLLQMAKGELKLGIADTEDIFKRAFPRSKVSWIPEGIPRNASEVRRFCVETNHPHKLLDALHSLRVTDGCCQNKTNCSCTRIVTESLIHERFGGLFALVTNEIELDETERRVPHSSRFGRSMESNKFTCFKVVLQYAREILHYRKLNGPPDTVRHNFASIHPDNADLGKISPIPKETLEKFYTHYMEKIWSMMADDTRKNKNGSTKYIGNFKSILIELRNKVVHEDPDSGWFTELQKPIDDNTDSFYDLLMMLCVSLIRSAKKEFPEAYEMVSNGSIGCTIQTGQFNLDDPIGPFDYRKDKKNKQRPRRRKW